MKMVRQAHHNTRGQSTLEYIVLATAVVAFVIFLTLGNSSMFQSRMKTTVDTTLTGLQSTVSKLTAAIQSK